MYSDKKQSRLPLLLALLALAAVIVIVLLLVLPGPEREEESIAAIEDAVRRCALQCYVVEGVYPPNLAYMEENYGLQVNTREYYVSYSAFSSNLPPTIRVLAH